MGVTTKEKEEALLELSIQRLHMPSWAAPLTREASNLMHDSRFVGFVKRLHA